MPAPRLQGIAHIWNNCTAPVIGRVALDPAPIRGSFVSATVAPKSSALSRGMGWSTSHALEECALARYLTACDVVGVDSVWKQRIVSGDVELFVAYTEVGAGHPLLVIHGGPDWDHSYLREPLAGLSGTRRLLLPDLRGCGRSSRGLPITEYHPNAVISDLLGILNTFGIAAADVLGFSYGGLLAQRLAVTAPERVHRLIIASSSLLPVPADAFAGWQERQDRRAPELEIWARSALGPERTQAAALAGARANVWRPEALPDYLRRLDTVRFSAEWDRARSAGTLQSPRIDNPIQALSATAVPILLLHGRQDMVFPAELAERTAAALPNAEAMVLDEAGHMAHIDQPQQWLTALEKFLS